MCLLHRNRTSRLDCKTTFLSELVELICMQMEGKKKKPRKTLAKLHHPIYLELYISTFRAILHLIALKSKSRACEVYTNKKTKTIYPPLFFFLMNYIKYKQTKVLHTWREHRLVLVSGEWPTLVNQIPRASEASPGPQFSIGSKMMFYFSNLL